MRKKFTCIVCPVSCNLAVEECEGILTVTGNQCKRGAKFGEDEYKRPKRMLTTTVKITGGNVGRLPVISRDEVPKERLFELVELLYELTVKSPVYRGDVILENIGDTGIDILATRTIKQTNKENENGRI